MLPQPLTRQFPIGHGLQELVSVVTNPPVRLPSILRPPEHVQHIKDGGWDSITFTSFTVEEALELGHLLHARLAPFSHTKPTLISISLANSSQVVFQVATGPGISPDNSSWVARKRATVMRFGTSTWLMHCKFNGDEAAFAAKYGLGPEAGQYAIHGGGIPIRVVGVEGLVAVVVVSGLTQAEDHGVIMDVIRDSWELKDSR